MIRRQRTTPESVSSSTGSGAVSSQRANAEIVACCARIIGSSCSSNANRRRSEIFSRICGVSVPGRTPQRDAVVK